MIDPRNIFLRSENVYLKALTEEDALSSSWYSWFNDPNTTGLMEKHYFPNTPQLQLEFFRKNIQGARDKLQLGIVPRREEKLVGVISLNQINFLNRSAEISMVIGEPDYRTIEITFESLRLIIEHGFYILNLRRIHGGTVTEDVKNLLCRTLNFCHEGTSKEAVYLNGKYMDAYQLGLLESQYPYRLSTIDSSE